MGGNANCLIGAEKAARYTARVGAVLSPFRSISRSAPRPFGRSKATFSEPNGIVRFACLPPTGRRARCTRYSRRRNSNWACDLRQGSCESYVDEH